MNLQQERGTNVTARYNTVSQNLKLKIVSLLCACGMIDNPE